MAITMDAREAPKDSGRGAGLKGARDAAELARAFRQARRHSALVKALRLAMPLTAAIVTGYYTLTLGIPAIWGKGRFKVEDVVLTADDMTMKNPTYFGLTKEGGRYEVRAKKAIVEFNKDAPIKLIDIDGDLMQANDVATKLKAKHGLLDNAKSELELYDGIEIDASNGLKARMARAMVYNKEHRVVSREPVDLTMPTGRVQGASMTMRTDTREATFIGSVKAHLVPSAQPGQNAPVVPAFGGNSRSPVDVTSEQLYVNDTEKTALFMGKVVAVQGESTLQAPELHITYEGKAAVEQLTGAAPQQSGEGSRLSRLVAKSGTVVTIGTDRRVTSEEADFDAKADTALFTGNVVVTQQKNVLLGKRLFIDRKAGTSRLEAPAEGGQPAGRIAATFYQGDQKTSAQAKQKSSPAAKSAGAAQESIAGMTGSFKTDPNAPMDIEADVLDVFDAEKRAVFHGNVKTKQGDFSVRTVEMTAFYSGQTGLMSGGGDAASKAQSELTRVEARRGVLITSKDGQSASGDWAIFDTKANTALLGDAVTVTRGNNVVQGSRLKIDLTSGMYRFEDEPVVQAAAPPASAPAVSASSALMAAPAPPGAQTGPEGRVCPPGKACAVIFPNELKQKAKDAAEKVLPEAAARIGESWEPSTSASPPQRGD
jgi:LPS export ABC transporter protein LptC